MSASTCVKCGQRYEYEHECPNDGEAILERIRALESKEVLPAEALEAARREHGGGYIRTRVRGGFVQRLDAKEEFAELTRLVLRCYPMSGGAPLIWTVKVGSRAHVDGLDSAPIEALRGRLVDLALRGREITWGRLSDPPVIDER